MASKEEQRLKCVASKKDVERYKFLREYFGQLVLTIDQESEILMPGVVNDKKLTLKAMAIQPSLKKIKGESLDKNIDEWIESFKQAKLAELKKEVGKGLRV